MKITRNFILLCTTVLVMLVAAVCVADDASMFRTEIKIMGRTAATVTADTIRIDDIAEISSPHSQDDESVIAIKKIVLGDSPLPGEETIVQGTAAVEALKLARVDLQQVRYTFPRSISVTRAARTVAEEEIRAAIDAALATQKRDISIKQLKYDNPIKVLPGVASIQAQELFEQTAGQVPFTVTIKVAGVPDKKFKVVALAEEWREVPIATRALPKGAVVGEADVTMARLTTAAIPRDAADHPAAILGRATSSNIGFGEVFQRTKLAIPPMIAAGARITMIVRTPFLEATATGIALEPGAAGEEIKVRNDASKKVVSGKVLDSSVVIVNPVGGPS